MRGKGEKEGKREKRVKRKEGKQGMKEGKGGRKDGRKRDKIPYRHFCFPLAALLDLYAHANVSGLVQLGSEQ